MGALFFSHIRVTNVKFINEKIPQIIQFACLWTLINWYFSLDFLEPLIIVCPRVAQGYSNIVVAWMWSPTNGNLSYFCLGTTFLLVLETLKRKNFETWLPATELMSVSSSISLSSCLVVVLRFGSFWFNLSLYEFYYIEIFKYLFFTALKYTIAPMGKETKQLYF